jgi:hypothetical protein
MAGAWSAVTTQSIALQSASRRTNVQTDCSITAVLDAVDSTLKGFSGTSNHTGDYVYASNPAPFSRLRLTSESFNTADISNMGSNSVDKNATGALEVRYGVARYAVNVFTSGSSVTSFLLP